MSDAFISEIRIFSISYAPRGWAFCNGQLLPIAQNQALFSLLGTTYGGDGRVNFALPDLRGRVPIHTGNGHTLGERGGEQAHTITTQEMAAHSHTLNAVTATGDAVVPTNNALADSPSQLYAPAAGSLTPLLPASVTTVGGSQAHQNMEPFLTLTFCICLSGIYPSQN